MTNPMQHHGWRPVTSLRAATAPLVLAFLLASAVITTQVAYAQTFITLHSFFGGDGDNPNAGLIQATDGNLYGTTYNGGDYGLGAVFQITPSGTLTVVHSFDGTDGANPYAGVIQASDGNFYGTTGYGGPQGQYGGGTIFRITPSGTFTTLYSFCSHGGSCTGGSVPLAGLVQASDGNFYGTTFYGGSHDHGTVFQITPSGTLTRLHSFCSQSACADGGGPSAALIQATDGNLYGTTFYGTHYQWGTVFQITLSGTLTTLHTFCSPGGCPDGAGSYAPLVQAKDGNLYGTTSGGGTYGGGTIFKITLGGTLTTLHSFCSQNGCADGKYPEAGLMQAASGNLYGTTTRGGADGYGTIFQITLSGTLTTLHRFDSTDGKYPKGGLVQAINRDLYGTTYLGGADNLGTVFSLSEGPERRRSSK
jgi:uncharacterized repeat protein (TIGR03803 family)